MLKKGVTIIENKKRRTSDTGIQGDFYMGLNTEVLMDSEGEHDMGDTDFDLNITNPKNVKEIVLQKNTSFFFLCEIVRERSSPRIMKTLS